MNLAQLLLSLNELFHDHERGKKRSAARAKNTQRLSVLGLLITLTVNSFTHQCHCSGNPQAHAQQSEPEVVSGPGSLTPADSPFSDNTNKFTFAHK